MIIFYLESDELSECPPPYIYNANLNLCWRIETEKMLSWSSARLQCSSEGGDLIVLDTPEKIAYIQKAVGMYFYCTNILS